MTVEARAVMPDVDALMSTVDVSIKIPGVFPYCSVRLTRL
jgi:hypothetical protein